MIGVSLSLIGEGGIGKPLGLEPFESRNFTAESEFLWIETQEPIDDFALFLA